MNTKHWILLVGISLLLIACSGIQSETVSTPHVAREELDPVDPTPAMATEEVLPIVETEEVAEPTARPEPVLVPEETVDGFGSLVDIVEAPLFEDADSGFGSLWLPVGNEGYVARVDLETGEIITTIEVGDPQGDVGTFEPVDPLSIVVTEDGVWATNRAGKSLVMIDPATNAISREIPIDVYGFLLAADGNLIWVTNPDNATVTRVNTGTEEVEAVINLGHPLYITAGAGSVWVAQPGHGQVSRIAPATNQVVAEISVGAVTEGIFFAADSIWVPLSHPTSLVRIDPATNEVSARISFEREHEFMWDLAFGTDSLWLRVGPGVPECDSTTSFIARIDPETNTETARMYLSCARNVYFAGDYLWVQMEEEDGDHVMARISPQQ